MRTMLAGFIHDESAQDLIEYGLLAAFVSLIALVAIGNIGTEVNDAYEAIEADVAPIS